MPELFEVVKEVSKDARVLVDDGGTVLRVGLSDMKKAFEKDYNPPTVSLKSSASSLTAKGSVTITATAADDVGVVSVAFFRNDILVSTASKAPYTHTDVFDTVDNGSYIYHAVVSDAAENMTKSLDVPLTVNVPSATRYDLFTDVPAATSVAGADWNVPGHTWSATKTYLVADGTGGAVVKDMPNIVAANYLAQADDVGQAVFFTTTGPRSSSGILLALVIGCTGSTPNHYPVNGIEAQLNGVSAFYLKDGTALANTAYDITAVTDYCLEVCRAPDTDGRTYRARLSKMVNGVRGPVISSHSLTIATARTTADTLVQIRTSAQNAAILKITRMEALTVPFDVAAETTTTVPAAGTTTPPKEAPVYLYPETGNVVAGPANLEFYFGAVGASTLVPMTEKLYSDMPVGHGSVTQSRWMSPPITVNGIQFVLFVGLDSDERADCWIPASFACAVGQQIPVNREHASVELRIKRNGEFVDLHREGTTYSWIQQRTTTYHWESEPMPWSTSRDAMLELVNNGTVLKHDSTVSFGSNSTSGKTSVDENPHYVPFKSFSDSTTASGAFKYEQDVRCGERLRATSTGGEQEAVGFVHGWLAHLISEIVSRNNPGWLTTNKLKSLQNLALSQAQYPHSGGLIFPEDQRLIDPSQVPLSTHRNFAAWGPCVGIPQPGVYYSTTENPYLNAMYDNAHPANKVSFHAWHLSKDPFHLFLTQAQAITCLAYTSSSKRGADGKILRIGIEEERGFWWALQTLVHAWHATPEGEMPRPFRDKAFFAKAIDNTLQFIRDNFMQESAAFSGMTYTAARFWRVLSPYYFASYPNEIFFSPYMSSYGSLVLGEMLMLGYSAGRDVVEWHSENIRLRTQAGGNWYISDRVVASNSSNGGLAQCIGKTTDTVLPYSNLAEWKAQYPRQSAYKDGALIVDDWKIDYGRDTYLFVGVLNVYAELARRGKITLTFDPVAEEQAFRDRHPGPYVSGANNLPINYDPFAKYITSYSK